jgi:phospholipid/cholesterol/gamma-HCH transport system substrate-binding protein
MRKELPEPEVLDQESRGQLLVKTVLQRYTKSAQREAAMAEITIRLSDRVLKAGIVLIVGICAAGAFYFLWSSHFFVPKYHLRTYVAEADGLLPGAPVRVDGIDVGTVESKNLAGKSATPQRRVELILRIEKPDQEMIRSDSTASLTSDGILGKRYVNIQRGFKGSPLNDGGEIALTPTIAKSVEGFFSSLSKMADCMRQESNSTGDQSQPPGSASPGAPR